MDKYDMVFSGSGGQGVITAAIILAEAAVMFENMHAVQSQSYGPEARGGATRSDVIISTDEIYYPKVSHPNLLVCLTQLSFNNYSNIAIPGGYIITDSRFVNINISSDAIIKELPIYDSVMDKIGNEIVLNMCMLGAVIKLTNIVHKNSIIKVLEERIPKKFIEMNEKAIDLGMGLL